jgi:hypothetical protein
MIRKSGNRFSEKIMLKQRDEIAVDGISQDHDLDIVAVVSIGS